MKFRAYKQRQRRALRHAWLVFRITLFGDYIHSGWDGEFDYHDYEWRGKTWRIPGRQV